jgi:DnaJ domain
MRMRKSAIEYYRALGLQPGASAREVRRAYLKLVKQWHPDRYTRDLRAQSLAQERVKEVNEAYSFLRDFKPGQPEHSYDVASYPSGATAQWHEYRRRTSHEPPIADPFEGDYRYRPVNAPRGGVRFASIIIALLVFNVARWAIAPGDLRSHSERVPVVNAAGPAKAMQVVFLGEEGRGEWKAARQQLPYFFAGSSKADVYRVQGVPDWSSEREWHYGDSRVYFAGDFVEHWKSRANVPLRAVNPGEAPPQSYISMGSSTTDVLAIQGAPDSVSDTYWQSADSVVTKTTYWHYGASKIGFAHGHVSGWEEKPGFPLRIAR